MDELAKYPELTETKEETASNNVLAKNSYLRGGVYYPYMFIPMVLFKEDCLDSYDRLVFGALLTFIRKGGKGKCFPSTDTIAQSLKISEKQVRRSLNALREDFWINWKNTGRSRRFRIYSLEARMANKDAFLKISEARATTCDYKNVKHSDNNTQIRLVQ